MHVCIWSQRPCALYFYFQPSANRKLGEEAKKAAADAVISKQFQDKVAQASESVGAEAVAALNSQVLSPFPGPRD